MRKMFQKHDLGRLEGVTGVTLRVWVVLVLVDSSLELTLGAKGDVSEEESRILEKVFQQVIVVITC